MPVVFRDTVTTIKTFNGSHGAFVIANVQSELGEFVLKDAVMDQFIGQDGQYQGAFLVTKIFTHTRMWKGRIIVEQRIKISKMKLVRIEATTLTLNDTEVECDPLLETAPDPQVCTAALAPEVVTPAVSVADAAEDTTTTGSTVRESEPVAPQAIAANSTAGTEQEAESVQDDGMAELFGQMWAKVQARLPVEITDWTDRTVIRRQREVLDGMGYRLDTSTMTWSMPESETA